MGFMDYVKKAFGVTDFDEINPSQYKNQLTLSAPTIDKLYSSQLGNLLRTQTINSHNLQMMASAGLMPGGALSSALARSQEGLSSGLMNAVPQIEQLRLNALTNYLGMQRQYDVDRMQHEYQNLANVGATLGALTNMLTQGYGTEKGSLIGKLISLF